jgi:hypothetical protein
MSYCWPIFGYPGHGQCKDDRYVNRANRQTRALTLPDVCRKERDAGVPGPSWQRGVLVLPLPLLQGNSVSFRSVLPVAVLKKGTKNEIGADELESNFKRIFRKRVEKFSAFIYFSLMKAYTGILHMLLTLIDVGTSVADPDPCPNPDPPGRA